METCKIASNKSGTKVAYFAMITMETVDAAAKCIRTLHESQFKGSKIIVKKVGVGSELNSLIRLGSKC